MTLQERITKRRYQKTLKKQIYCDSNKYVKYLEFLDRNKKIKNFLIEARRKKVYGKK